MFLIGVGVRPLEADGDVGLLHAQTCAPARESWESRWPCELVQYSVAPQPSKAACHDNACVLA